MKREDGRQQVLRTGEKYSIAGPVLCGDPTEVHAPTSRRFSGKGVMRGSGLRSSGVKNGSIVFGVFEYGVPKNRSIVFGVFEYGVPKRSIVFGAFEYGVPKNRSIV